MSVLLINNFVAIMKLVAIVKFIAIIILVVAMSHLLIMSFVVFETQSRDKTRSYCDIYSPS